MKFLIKNATVALPEGLTETSVLVDGAKIVDIAPAAQIIADEVIDATGLHLLPGIIDDQVHFRDPGLTHKEDLYTGSRACAKGGVTTFLEMPNTNPTTTSVEALEAKLELAAGKCLVNYGFYVGATPHNVSQLQEAHKTPGIKIFIGSSTGDLLVDEQEALERIFAETTLPICAHCEDETTIGLNKSRIAVASDVANHSLIRDERAAVVATARSIDLALRHQHRFHVLHVSTAAEVPLIADEKTRPYITAEVCPHHLFFNTTDYPRLGTWVQMNPSVKSPRDNKLLFDALRNGAIQVVATDHAPHTIEEKQQPYPNSPSGIPAVENSLALMLNEVNKGSCTIEQVVHWMCDAPARVWDIIDKGRIAVGYDADLVLVDMNRQATVLNEQQVTKSKWSPWHGEELTGWPIRTWVMGQEVFRAGPDQSGEFDESHRGSPAKFDHARGGYWATQ